MQVHVPESAAQPGDLRCRELLAAGDRAAKAAANSTMTPAFARGGGPVKMGVGDIPLIPSR